MSDLGIFSLLIVGRDMPHPFAGLSDEPTRSTDRLTPVVLRPVSRALEPLVELEGQSPSRDSRRVS